MSERTWWTPRELAAQLGVSGMTVYRLIHDGSIPVRRVGRTMQILPETVEEVLRSGVVYTSQFDR